MKNPNETYQETTDIEGYAPDEQQKHHLQELFSITDFCEAEKIGYAVFGGYGLDGLYGKLTRDHSDIDLLVKEVDRERLEDHLIASGYSKDEKTSHNEKSVYRNSRDPQSLKVEISPDTVPAKYTNEPFENFIPTDPTAALEGHLFKALPLELVEVIIEVQNTRAQARGWAEYPESKIRNRNQLLKALRELKDR